MAGNATSAEGVMRGEAGGATLGGADAVHAGDVAARAEPVIVTNVGGTSAENVTVEVTVGDVTREVNLDPVAKGDTESAVWSPPTQRARPRPKS